MYFLYECGLFYENVTHLVRLWLNYVHKYHLCSWCWQKNIAICEIWVKLHWYCFWECQRAVLFVIVWYCYFSYLYICICLVWKEASKYCLVCFGYQKVHFCSGLVTDLLTDLRTLVDVKSLSRLKRGCLVFGCVIETSEEFYES